jgi:hypothetical protein
MILWKDGERPLYMDSTEKGILTNGMVIRAVSGMTEEGLQTIAAAFLLTMNKIGLSPAEIEQTVNLRTTKEASNAEKASA